MPAARSIRLASAFVVLAAASTASAAQGVAADWILSALARPAPVRTDFVELRGCLLYTSRCV